MSLFNQLWKLVWPELSPPPVRRLGRLPRSRRPRYQLSLEPLEARVVPAIVVSPPTLTDWTVTQPGYSETLTAAGGTAPYFFATSSGTLPSGLTLSTTGLLSGTPTATGSFSFTVTATDSRQMTGSQNYTVIINPFPLFTTTSLPDGRLTVPYDQAIGTSGGTTPLVFSLATGTLPPGLTLSSTGVLTGTPTKTGSYEFDVIAIDIADASASLGFSITIGAAPVALSPATLPNWTVNQPGYQQTISATGGTGAFGYTTTAGTLPPGLTLAFSSGVLSGTATATGTFSFTITATDTSMDTASQNYTVTINAAPAITPTSLPNGDVGVAYRQTIVVTGGTAPLTFAETGTLPSGLTLGSTGVLSGTPTTSGSFSFTVSAKDAAGATAARPYSVTIHPALAITTTTLPGGKVGFPYAQTIVATGGSGSYSFGTSAGTLPTGLTLSTTGVLSGMPTVQGTFTFTIALTDSLGGSASQPYSVLIAPATPLSVIPTVLPDGDVGLSYNQTITATGGTPPYTFFTSSGTLPTGITLSTVGILSGAPTATGTFHFTVGAMDSSIYDTGSQNYAVTIHPALAITTTTLPPGRTTAAYSQTISTTGGTGPVSFHSTGTLPTGLTLGSSGVLSGTLTTAGSFSFTITALDSIGGSSSQNYTMAVLASGASNITISTQPTSGGVFLGGIFTPTAATATVNNGDIEALLNDGIIVTINTASVFGSPGNITEAAGATIAKTDGEDADLVLLADNAIALSQAISSSAGQLSVSLSAKTSDTVGATITTNGGVFNSSGTTFNNTGGAISTAGGAIAIAQSDAVTIGGNLSAGRGSVTVQGAGAITINAPVTSTGGSVTVQAGATSTSITVSAVITGSPINIMGGAGNDTITVGVTGPTAATNSLNLDGGSGTTAFTISSAAKKLDQIQSPITINGGTGISTLNVDESGSTTRDIVYVTSAVIYSNAVGGFKPIFYRSTGGTFAGGISVLTGAGNDIVNVQSTRADGSTHISTGAGNDFVLVSSAPSGIGTLSGIAAPLIVDGGSGNNRLEVSEAAATTGDTVFVTSSVIYSNNVGGFKPIFYQATGGNFSGGVSVLAGSGNNGIIVENNRADANTLVSTGSGKNVFLVSSDPSGNGTLAGIAGRLTLLGGTGTSTLIVSDKANAGATAYTVLTNASIERPDGVAPIIYATSGTFANVFLSMGQGNNTMNVRSTLAAAGLTTVQTGAGNSNVTVSTTPDGSGGVLSFISGRLAIAAGKGNNQFTVSEAGRSAADTVAFTSNSIISATGVFAPISYAGNFTAGTPRTTSVGTSVPGSIALLLGQATSLFLSSKPATATLFIKMGAGASPNTATIDVFTSSAYTGLTVDLVSGANILNVVDSSGGGQSFVYPGTVPLTGKYNVVYGSSTSEVDFIGISFQPLF